MSQGPRKRAEILGCPNCGNDVGVTLGEVARVEACAHCGQGFVVPSVEGWTEVPTSDESFVIDDEPDDESDAARKERQRREREERLDALRVAAVTTERRMLHRRWSFSVGLGAGCCIVAIQAALLIFKSVDTAAPRSRALALAVLAAGAVYGALFFFRRAARSAGKLKKPLLPDPETDPRFDDLQDGSQQWKNLEKLK